MCPKEPLRTWPPVWVDRDPDPLSPSMGAPFSPAVIGQADVAFNAKYAQFSRRHDDGVRLERGSESKRVPAE